MKDPDTTLETTSWCFYRKWSIAFRIFKPKNWPENKRWWKFVLESCSTGVLYYFHKHMMPRRVVYMCHTLRWRFWGYCSKRAEKLKSLQQSQVYFFSSLSPHCCWLLLFVLPTLSLVLSSHPASQLMLLPGLGWVHAPARLLLPRHSWDIPGPL